MASTNVSANLLSNWIGRAFFNPPFFGPVSSIANPIIKSQSLSKHKVYLFRVVLELGLMGFKVQALVVTNPCELLQVRKVDCGEDRVTVVKVVVGEGGLFEALLVGFREPGFDFVSTVME
jgi:hypothetical protein